MRLVVERRPTFYYLLYSLKKQSFDMVISEEWQVQERKNRNTEGNYNGTSNIKHFVSKLYFMKGPLHVNL
jgi:hypothetical protein